MARGRKPQVRYWQRKGGGYFATIKGNKVELALGPDDSPTGPTYIKALAEFAKRMALDTNKGTNDYLVSALMNQYRLELRKKKSPDVIATWESMCQSFALGYGKLKVGELQPYHFNEWLAGQETRWNATTQNHAGRLVLSAVSWAARQGFIASNHLVGRVDLPRAVVRGKEFRMSSKLCDLLVRAAKSEAFRNLLLMLRETGARPAEVWKAEAFNYRQGSLIYRWNTPRGYVHKTARKTQRDRIIYLTPDLDNLVKGLCGKYPTGPLFRNTKGNAWNRPNIHHHWRRCLENAHIALHCLWPENDVNVDSLVPYCFRHTWISNWVDSGRSIHVCAKLCGTSVSMIERVYGHPDDSIMQKAYLDFMSRESDEKATL